MQHRQLFVDHAVRKVMSYEVFLHTLQNEVSHELKCIVKRFRYLLVLFYVYFLLLHFYNNSCVLYHTTNSVHL